MEDRAFRDLRHGYFSFSLKNKNQEKNVRSFSKKLALSSLRERRKDTENAIISGPPVILMGN